LDQQKNIIKEADFEFALSRIRESSLVGLIDHYDECMLLFEKFLRPHFPDIDLSYVKQNVTKGRGTSMKERISAVFADLGVTISDELLVNNHWDLNLYLEVKKVINGRINSLQGHSDLANNFQKRCLAHKLRG
jgi:hypothetical protein